MTDQFAGHENAGTYEHDGPKMTAGCEITGEKVCLQLSHTAISKLHGSVLCLKYFMLRAVMLILLVKCVNVIVLRLRLLIDEPVES